MAFQPPKLGRQTTLFAFFFSFLFPFNCSMALESNLADIERLSTDTAINGAYWVRYNIDGKTVISDALQFGQPFGLFYAQESGKAPIQLFFHSESSRFYVKEGGSEARWLQNADHKAPHFARDRKVLRDLGHLLIERFSEEDDAVAFLQKTFDYGRIDDKPTIGLKQPGLRFTLKSERSAVDMSREFSENPGQWIASPDEGCTDQGCFYQHATKAGHQFLVSPKLKELVYFEKVEATKATEIPEVASHEEIDRAVQDAANSGARYLVVNVGRLDTCPHCVTLHGSLKRFLKKRKDVCVLHIHKQHHPELARSFGYDGQGLPWTLVFDLRKRKPARHGHHEKAFRLTKSVEELEQLMVLE